MVPLLWLLVAPTRVEASKENVLLSLTSNVRNQSSEEPAHERDDRFCKRGVGAALEWPDVLHHLKGNQRGKWPTAYRVAIPTVGACLLVIAFLLVPHLRSLQAAARDQETGRGGQVTLIASVPLAVTALKYVAVLAPRTWKPLYILVAIYEVLAFRAFKNLVLELVSVDNDGRDPVKVMAEAEPVAPWAVPPLGCCFRPCAKKRHFTPTDDWVTQALLVQFMVVKPVVAVIEMTETLTHGQEERLGRVELLSLLLAMYGLFSLLESSHAVLPERRHGHSKFWVIKGVFIASTATFRLCTETFRTDLKAGEFCYTSETLATAWAAAIMAVLCVPLARLAVYAFPVTDLFPLTKAEERGESLEVPLLEHEEGRPGAAEGQGKDRL